MLVHYWTRGRILDVYTHHQRTQHFIPDLFECGGAIRPVIHRDQTEYRPAREGNAKTCIALIFRICIPLFQPGNFQIAAVNMVDLRLLVRLPLAVERLPQRIVERQLANVLGGNPKNRYPQIAAFDRRRLVVKMHRACVRLHDPVARTIESQCAAVDNANGIARFAFPSVIIFQLEMFDAHVRILQLTVYVR
jgi:hypothetical protein